MRLPMNQVLKKILLPCFVCFTVLLTSNTVNTPLIQADGKTYANIRDFGAAGNGFTDDSDAIQRAINAVQSVAGTVIIPAGLFRMAKGVFVPKGVKIEGMISATTGPWQNWLDAEGKGASPIFGGSAGALWASAEYIRGSWILADNSVGEINGTPTFLLDGNTAISKLGFINRSAAPVTSTPNSSPPLIGVFSDKITQGATSGITISDISLANCYIGIAIVQGSDLNNYYIGKESTKSNVGKVVISNIMGSPLYKGIMIKGISSAIEMNNLQFNYSCYEGNHIRMRMQMAVDVELSCAQNVSIVDMLTFGANSGVLTKPAYSSRKVGLTAQNLNLEGQKAICLLSSGTYNISNSYFFMVNFANAAIDKDFRAILVKQDASSTSACTYNFTNCMVQNPIIFTDSNNDKWEDISIDLQLSANATAQFTNMQFYGMDQQGNSPVVQYIHQSGSNTKVLFKNAIFVTDMTNPLIQTTGDALTPGEVVFENCRFPFKAMLPQGNSVVFNQCTRYNGTQNTFYEKAN